MAKKAKEPRGTDRRCTKCILNDGAICTKCILKLAEETLFLSFIYVIKGRMVNIYIRKILSD